MTATEHVAEALRSALRKVTVEPSPWRVDAWEEGQHVAGRIKALLSGQKIGVTIRVAADMTEKAWMGRLVLAAAEAVDEVMRRAREDGHRRMMTERGW